MLTRTGSFDEVKAVLESLATEGGTGYWDASIPGWAGSSRNATFATWANTDSLDLIWPDGEAAPKTLVATPAYYEWIDNFASAVTGRKY